MSEGKGTLLACGRRTVRVHARETGTLRVRLHIRTVPFNRKLCASGSQKCSARNHATLESSDKDQRTQAVSISRLQTRGTCNPFSVGATSCSTSKRKPDDPCRLLHMFGIDITQDAPATFQSCRLPSVALYGSTLQYVLRHLPRSFI